MPGASLSKRRWPPILKGCTTPIGKAVTRPAQTQTFVDAARVACALERYRLANGRLPEKLDALAPQFIDRIPNDVIDGQPLRYQQTGEGGYRLYSIGWNQQDDGGEIAWRSENQNEVEITEGDWVWVMPGK